MFTLDSAPVEKSKMKECAKIQAFNSGETRKARVEKQNLLIRNKMKTPEPSILGSISLNSLSLRTEDEESSLNNFSTRSKRPSDIFNECAKSSYDVLSEKDQKILRLMAARREAKIEESEKAVAAKWIWEEDKLRQAKRSKEKQATLSEYLIGKRQLEKIHQSMRKRDKEERQKEEKLLLETKIAEEHEKAEKRHENFQLKKLQVQISSSKNRALVQWALKRQREEEEEAEKVRRLTICEGKEKKSEEALMWIAMERNRRLREERRRRELKWEAARNQREAINRQHEEEQKSKLKMLRIREENQAEKLMNARQWKRRLAIEKNSAKKQQHSFLYAKVRVEDAEKINQMLGKIQEKDTKTRTFCEKRQTAILKSKRRATETANLRQKIQSLYTL